MAENARIGCPKCGNVIEFPVSIAGHVTNCPSCNKSVDLVLPQAAPKLESKPKYYVTPFMAVIKEGDTAGVEKAGKQFEKLLNQLNAEGWEYVRKETISVSVNPGCLGGFLSNGPSYANYEYIVFKRNQ